MLHKCEATPFGLAVVPLPAAVSALFIPVEKQATYSADDFASFLDVVVSREVFADKTSEVVNKIREFYLNHDAPAAKNSVFYLRRYTQVHTTRSVLVGGDTLAMLGPGIRCPDPPRSGSEDKVQLARLPLRQQPSEQDPSWQVRI